MSNLSAPFVRLLDVGREFAHQAIAEIALSIVPPETGAKS